MTDDLMIASIAVLVGFLGFIAGGVAGYVIQRLFFYRVTHLYTFSGGMLGGLIIFEIIPEMFQQLNVWGMALGIGIGFLSLLTVEAFTHQKGPSSSWTILFLVFAIGLHTLPTGWAFGSGIQVGTGVSSSLLMAIVLHHIPEGMALTFLMIKEELNLVIFIVTSAILSLVLGFGTWTGLHMDGTFSKLNALLMGGAIGSMGYVACYEMLWKTKKALPIHQFLFFSLAGMLVIWGYLILI